MALGSNATIDLLDFSNSGNIDPVVAEYLQHIANCKFRSLRMSTPGFCQNAWTLRRYKRAFRLLYGLYMLWKGQGLRFNLFLFLDSWIDFLINTKSQEHISIREQINSEVNDFCAYSNTNFSPSTRRSVVKGFRGICKLLWQAGFIIYRSLNMINEIRSDGFLQVQADSQGTTNTGDA